MHSFDWNTSHNVKSQVLSTHISNCFQKIVMDEFISVVTVLVVKCNLMSRSSLDSLSPLEFTNGVCHSLSFRLSLIIMYPHLNNGAVGHHLTYSQDKGVVELCASAAS